MFAARNVMFAARKPTVSRSSAVSGHGLLSASAHREFTLLGNGVLSSVTKQIASRSPALSGHGVLSAAAQNASGPPSFDTISGDYISNVTSGTAVNLTITAAAGADVFLDISDSANISYSAVKANGTAMSSEFTTTHNATANDGSFHRYRLAKAGTGSAITVTFTPGANGVANAVAYSYKNVNTCSTTGGNPGLVATTQNYTTPTLTFGGQLIVCASSWGPNYASPASHSATAGTARYFSSTSTAAGLYLLDSTANTALTISLFAANAWAYAVSTLT